MLPNEKQNELQVSLISLCCVFVIKAALTLGWHAGLDHSITRILAALSPQEVQAVLGLMVKRVPRTLEALLMHALPPAAAELLTQKLEQADNERPEAGATITNNAQTLRRTMLPIWQPHIEIYIYFNLALTVCDNSMQLELLCFAV